MKRLSLAKPFAAAAFAIGALAVAGTAHARTDVGISIGVHVPFGYAQPVPVYVQPAPVYVQPQPVYVHPQPVYVQPRPIYHRPHHYGYGHGHGRHRGPWGDADRDGVPNRYDHAPHNPYRR